MAVTGETLSFFPRRTMESSLKKTLPSLFMGPPAFQFFLTHTHFLEILSVRGPPLHVHRELGWTDRGPSFLLSPHREENPNVPRPSPCFHGFLGTIYRIECRLWCLMFDSQPKKMNPCYREWLWKPQRVHEVWITKPHSAHMLKVRKAKGPHFPFIVLHT